MTLPVDGIKLHRGNFAAIGQQIQPLLDAGQYFRLQVKPWREKRSLSQNALSHMWYTEISEYLIARGKTFATPEWVKDAMKHTYLGYESKDRVDVVSGEVTTINDAAVQDPALVGADPYGAGWLYEVTPGAVGQLLTAAEYAAQNGADA